MKKILVANRGEIALRVMKTAKKMGLKTVAIYSDADRNAPHVRYAGEAVYIGNSPSSESYLVADKIVNAAKSVNADAIHPGYGFLSENADFARQVEGEMITFIGPSPESIKIMGDKLAAKEAVRKYNIPMVPGTDGAISDELLAIGLGKKIGFPILIKASAGGGGKGMRIVYNEEELPEQMERAISEARSTFGDGSVFIEKFLTSPRHIEIQILADRHGNIIHLYERECSIQRRHQKVIEEAPSVILSPETRESIAEAAIKVAKACNYIGAGTVEFLLDADQNFYFLEMNTRLQVEHPVTEMITGIDLVEQQIRVARHEKLALRQSDISINGHALELRIYAENPLNDFLPSVGELKSYVRPTNQGIRVDDGYDEGMEIPIHYDPMIAKLIAHGQTREEALKIMLDAIDRYKIEGISTTLPFGKFVFEHANFISGDFDTLFIQKYYSSEKILEEQKDEAEIAAKLALRLYLQSRRKLINGKNKVADWTLSRKN